MWMVLPAGPGIATAQTAERMHPVRKAKLPARSTASAQPLTTTVLRVAV